MAAPHDQKRLVAVVTKTLFYFCQRGRHRGWWRRVPMQSRVADLRSRLTARGHMITEAY